MFIAIVSIFTFVAIATIGLFERKRRPSKNKAVETPVKEKTKAVKTSELSWPARQVIKKYDAIPEAHRPNYDVKAMMTALDTKHETSEVNSHFAYYDYYGIDNYKRSFNCTCLVERNSYGDVTGYVDDGVCTYAEYGEIISTMNEISEALHAKARAEADYEKQIALAGVQNDLKTIESFKESIRDEAASIKEAASAYIY